MIPLVSCSLVDPATIMSRIAVIIGAAEIIGAIALGITTFTVPAFVDMALAWRMLAVFMTVEGGNRVSNNVSV